MTSKRRKKGAWLDVARAHAAVPRVMHNGRGLSNIPVPFAGSAAYRRLLAKRNKRYG